MARDDDELEYDDEDEDENGGFFRWLQAVVVLFALGGFFGLAWYAYKSGDTVDDKDIEVVKSDKTPIKEAPADPGGMQIPNQDKTVYNLVNGDNHEKPVAERIIPPTEEPMKKHPATETWMDDKLKTRKTDNSAQAKQFAPPTSTPLIREDAKEQPAQASTPNKPVLAQETPAPSHAAVAKPEPAKAAPAAQPEEEEADETPAPQPKATPQKAAAAPASAPAPTDQGSLPKYRVQLGAYQSQAEADKEWKRISGEYSDNLGSKQHYVMNVLVKGKHYYRLQAGPFASSKAAESVCVSLVGDGQGCFLAKSK